MKGGSQLAVRSKTSVSGSKRPSAGVNVTAGRSGCSGEVTLPRQQVKSIRPTESGRYLFEGPTGLEGWTVSQTKDDEENAWKFSNGVGVKIAGGGSSQADGIAATSARLVSLRAIAADASGNYQRDFCGDGQTNS